LALATKPTVGLRYYNPQTGRYISRDPAGFPNGLNNYLYVNDNPINRIDPLGLDDGEPGFLGRLGGSLHAIGNAMASGVGLSTYNAQLQQEYNPLLRATKQGGWVEGATKASFGIAAAATAVAAAPMVAAGVTATATTVTAAATTVATDVSATTAAYTAGGLKAAAAIAVTSQTGVTGIVVAESLVGINSRGGGGNSAALAENGATKAIAAARAEAAAIRAAGNTNGVAGAIVKDGETFIGQSTRAGGGGSDTLHPDVQAALDRVPAALRSPFHEKCAEPQGLSRMLENGVNPEGSTSAAVRVGDDAVKPACPSCAHILDHFGVNDAATSGHWLEILWHIKKK
jgi:uncharacterized protein RhaS with RHS repeats